MPLRNAIRDCDTGWIRQYTGDINERDCFGYTPLRLALLPMRATCTLDQRLAVLGALLKKANFDIDKPCDGFTAVTWASYDSGLEVEVLRWLVDTGGADVNVADESGSFGIHRAVESGVVSGDTRKIEYLLSLAQLDVSVRNSVGDSVLDIVRRFFETLYDKTARRVAEWLETHLTVRCPLSFVISLLAIGW
jgi:hypothetical protein